MKKKVIIIIPIILIFLIIFLLFVKFWSIENSPLKNFTIVRIDTSDIDNIIDVVLSKNNKLYNRVGKGYKYYVPRGINYIDTTELNDKLYSNGYYYYNNKLSSGQTSSSVFEGIVISDKVGNEFAGKQMNLKINGQAVQAKNNGNSSLQALGWSE